MTAKVANLDFKSIGVVGLLLFIYAAVALADSVEQIFNRIFDAPTHRPIHIRVAIHWAIITLGSGLLAMSLYMSAQVVQWFVEIGAGSDSQLYLSHLLSIVASWVLMFLLYALMPNTHVSVKAAGVGALVGATLWEAAKVWFPNLCRQSAAVFGDLRIDRTDSAVSVLDLCHLDDRPVRIDYHLRGPAIARECPGTGNRDGQFLDGRP